MYSPSAKLCAQPKVVIQSLCCSGIIIPSITAISETFTGIFGRFYHLLLSNYVSYDLNACAFISAFLLYRKFDILNVILHLGKRLAYSKSGRMNNCIGSLLLSQLLLLLFLMCPFASATQYGNLSP